jgi:hypothetical protein
MATDIKKAAQELKEIADEHPIELLALAKGETPILMDSRHRRDLSIGSCRFRIQFTKDGIGGRYFYHLSIGVPTGNPYDPKVLPDHIIKQVREAFFKDGGNSMPSVLGNSLQFISTEHF